MHWQHQVVRCKAEVGADVLHSIRVPRGPRAHTISLHTWTSCYLPILGTHCACRECLLLVHLHLPHRGTTVHDFRLGSSRKENTTHPSAYSKSCTGTMQYCNQKPPSSSYHSPLVTCSCPSSHHHRQCHEGERLCHFDSGLSTTLILISVRRGGTCQFEWQVIQNFKHCFDINPSMRFNK